MRVYLGGTFDPVHQGHIQMAAELVSELELDRLYLMPCAKAVHKDKVAASSKQRLAMLNLAIEAYPSLLIDERELQQEKPSYTFDSLQSIRKEVGEGSVSFVMGLDSLLSFPSWYKADRIHELVNLIIIDRPPSSFGVSEQKSLLDREEALGALIKLGFSLADDHNDLKKSNSGKAHFLALSLYDISSTEIRTLSKQNKVITHLVGDKVAEYIQMHQLYQ